MSITKGHKYSFRDFNDMWDKAGNFAYTITFQNLRKAHELEEQLLKLGYQRSAYSAMINWGDGRRIRFYLRVAPRQKFFYRINKKEITKTSYFKDRYTEDFFDSICFKFIMIEKSIK